MVVCYEVCPDKTLGLITPYILLLFFVREISILFIQESTSAFGLG